MSTDHILKLLFEERCIIERAISILQGSAPLKRAGRPPVKKVADPYDDPTMPDWVKPAATKVAPAKKKRKLSAAGRAAIIAGTKARWARIKAEKAAKSAPRRTSKAVNATAVTPTEDAEFKAKMSAAMKKSTKQQRVGK
jgi:hypothetical protein